MHIQKVETKVYRGYSNVLLNMAFISSSEVENIYISRVKQKTYLTKTFEFFLLYTTNLTKRGKFQYLQINSNFSLSPLAANIRTCKSDTKQVAQRARMLTREPLYKVRTNGNINFSDT